MTNCAFPAYAACFHELDVGNMVAVGMLADDLPVGMAFGYACQAGGEGFLFFTIDISDLAFILVCHKAFASSH